MIEILEIFSNRELALIIWVLFIAIGSILWKKTRGASIHLIRTFLKRRIIVLQILIWSYASGVLWVFYKLGLWNWSMLKDSIIWAVFSAFIIMFGVLTVKKKNQQIKQTLLDAFKLIVIVEFVVNLYSFGFIAEMILLPSLAIVAALIAVAESNPEHQIVANFLNWALAFWGVYVLYSSTTQIYIHIIEVTTKQTALDFLMPMWLTLMYIPFLFLVKRYSDWEQERKISKVRNR